MKNFKINGRLRNQAAHKLHAITKGMQPTIPMIDIMDALEELGIVVLQEDNTRWAGMFVGRQGSADFELGDLDSEEKDGTFHRVQNSMLRMTWYRFDTGRYEIVAYLS